MPSKKPEITQEAMYQLLRVDNVKAFNIKRESGQSCDLRGLNFRALDLRGLNADGLDFTDGYFRDANLRGIDFTQSDLRGASLRGAKISGCLFPIELSPAEIRMSFEIGTRLRYNEE